MVIRDAVISEISEILQVFSVAKSYMKANGNPTQWTENYPSMETLQTDIQNKWMKTIISGDEIVGVFVVQTTPESSYETIYEGSWRCDLPYAAIHRIASNGKAKGVFKEALNYTKAHYDYIRIDTHKNNKTMIHLMENSGFEYSGIIYVDDGTPRVAYEYIK